MTQTTDQERELFEAWALADTMNRDERDSDGKYQQLKMQWLWEAWKAARRAPAAPVPQETCVICGSDEPYTGTCGSNDPRALCKKPAPQPPEAAPVQLPEPVAWRDPKNLCTEQSCTYQKWKRESWPHIYTEALYTEQQVRQLLATHGIGST